MNREHSVRLCRQDQIFRGPWAVCQELRMLLLFHWPRENGLRHFEISAGMHLFQGQTGKICGSSRIHWPSLTRVPVVHDTLPQPYRSPEVRRWSDQQGTCRIPYFLHRKLLEHCKKNLIRAAWIVDLDAPQVAIRITVPSERSDMTSRASQTSTRPSSSSPTLPE